MVINPKHETFVVYGTSFTSFAYIYLSRRPQIVGLIAKKALIKVFTKYANFADIFSPNLAFKLSKQY